MNEHQSQVDVPLLREQLANAVRRIDEQNADRAQRGADVERRFERLEKKLEDLMPLPTEIRAINREVHGLSDAVGTLSLKIDSMASAQGSARRGDWSIAIQIVSVALATLMGFGGMILAFVKLGHP